MALQLRYLKGYKYVLSAACWFGRFQITRPWTLLTPVWHSATLRGNLKAHPTVADAYFYTTGKVLVGASQSNGQGQRLARGHDDDITSFAMSNTGGLVATGQQGRNADVVVWDAYSLAQKFRFQEHDHAVAAMAFSPDDKLLATVGSERDKKIFFLDTATGKIVTTGQLPAQKATAVAWSAACGQSYLCATALDMDIMLWTVDPFKGTIQSDMVVPGSVRRTYTSLLFSSDGQWLYGGTASGDVVMVNVLRKAVQMLHPVCGGAVGGLLPLPDGQLLVAGGDGTLGLFNPVNMRQQSAPLMMVPGIITSLSAVAGTGGYLVGCQQGTAYGVHPATGAAQQLLHTHTAPLRSVTYDKSNPGVVIVGAEDGTISEWHVQSGMLLGRVLEQRAGAALCLCATPTELISGWADGNIRCHGRGGGAAVTQTQAKWVIPGAHALASSCGVTAMRLSSKADLLFTGGAGGEIRVWDLRTRRMVHHLKLQTMAITDMALLSDDRHICASSDDRSWTLWDSEQEKCKVAFPSPGGAIKGLAVAPDQVQVVTVGMDRKLIFWDIRAPNPVRTIDAAHATELSCVAINNRGDKIASAGIDAIIKVWDFATGALRGEFQSHSRTVTKLMFSPDDAQLVSTSEDSTLMIWNVAA